MAKVIEHGKYWKEEVQKAYPDVRVRCPECDNIFCISSYNIYIDNTEEVWCECGCKFIPEASDIVKELV